LKKIFKIIIAMLVLIVVVFSIFRIMCFLYPNRYKVSVEKYSKEYDLSKDLVYAVIKAESNFESDAVSIKGAKGLMQIMDKTATWSAEKIGIEDFCEEELFSPDTNIRIGCFYLSYLLDMYDGNEKNALSAYNAGQAKVDSWLKDTRYSKDGKTLDKIPYRETQKYVKNVEKNIKIYDFLY